MATKRVVLKLTPRDASTPSLACEDGAHNYTVIGMEALPNLSRPDMTLVQIGRQDQVSKSQQPVSMAFDRCYNRLRAVAQAAHQLI